ncbi:polyketide cyclase/dehydrase/lipid transport protein [Herbihabitans rhizosphaerae]|uniref:Polyketide cyclase/dehydrase/lipid transport protein n=1 Tax=Herbihabitans rhizosphaerae TaxID=1872711 RepID=A0A4Q7KE52_9PSEU|nr:SRPBCC family protein [Herbihabitans rhizosphaerae]RZS29460.1 polyketide cyclase/dehydrase/lipid transport protein [Herbihabitans rhizosphaerae]
MGLQKLDVTTHTTADPGTVFALLRDGSTWPKWSNIDEFTLEEQGDGEPEGVGALRKFRNGRITGWDRTRELITDRRFGYDHVRGLPVKGYQGTVDIEPDGERTKIHWVCTFRPRIPGTGWFWQRVLQKFLRDNVEGLAAYAAKQSTVD